MQDLSPLELTYCVAVLLFTFALRGSLGFGGAIGLPLLALVIPVKILAPAWSLVGIVSSAAIIGRDRRHVARRAFVMRQRRIFELAEKAILPDESIRAGTNREVSSSRATVWGERCGA